MVRKLGIIGAVVASLFLAFGATQASAKGGMGGGKGGWGHAGVGIGIGAGIGLGLGLAAIAARSAEPANCYRQRIVTPEGDVLIRRVCD